MSCSADRADAHEDREHPAHLGSLHARRTHDGKAENTGSVAAPLPHQGHELDGCRPLLTISRKRGMCDRPAPRSVAGAR